MTDLTHLPTGHGRRIAPRTRLDPYPRNTLTRWLVRLAFAVPFVIVSILASFGGEHGESRNDLLIARAAEIDWSRGDPQWLAQLYPPIPTLFALAAPDALLLAIIGSLIAGIFIQWMMEIMVQRRLPVTTVAILLVALAANPLFAYLATENLPVILALAFFGRGISDTVRFVRWGNTQAGFNAGLMFMFATLSDLSSLLYVASLVLTVPFLPVGRRHQSGAKWANMLVLVFPTLSALGTWVVLNLAFLGTPFGTDTPFAGAAAGAASLSALLSPSGFLIMASVLSAWVIALIVRRPGAIIVSTLVFGTILLGVAVGITAPTAVGITYILMLLLAIAFIPAARKPGAIIMVDLVAIAQIWIAWATALSRDITVDWLQAVVEGARALFGL